MDEEKVMNKKKQKKVKSKTYSISRQIMGIIMTVIISLIVILFLYFYYSLTSYYRDIETSNAVAYKYYLDKLENTIIEVDEFLAEINVNNNDFNSLKSLGENTELYRYLSSYNLATLFSLKISTVNGLNGLVMAYDNATSFRYQFVNNIDYDKKIDLLQFIQGQAAESATDWQLAVAEEEPYLVRISGNKGTYLAAVLDFMVLTSHAYDENEGSVEFIFRYGDQIISNAKLAQELDFINAASKSLEHDSIKFYLNDYYIIGCSVGTTDLMMYMLFPSRHFTQLRTSQVFLLIILGVNCLAVPFVYYILKKKMVSPLRYLVCTMEEIKAGNLEVVMENPYNIEEFLKLYEAFNGMMEEIKKLRIAAYEEEIEKQKARLQYLQLQIKPHFYLNCLKSLNAMVIGEKYEKMQDLIIGTSDHLRYMFRDNFELVTLDEELNNVKKYFELQKIAYSVEFEYFMDIESAVTSYKVPSLTIQTFVENSIKYGIKDGQVLKIQIKSIELQTEEGRFLDLTISDNGSGYPQDILEIINGEESTIYENQHVGIINLKSRFHLLYDIDVEYVFMNQGGAVSELIIPYVG